MGANPIVCAEIEQEICCALSLYRFCVCLFIYKLPLLCLPNVDVTMSDFCVCVLVCVCLCCCCAPSCCRNSAQLTRSSIWSWCGVCNTVEKHIHTETHRHRALLVWFCNLRAYKLLCCAPPHCKHMAKNCIIKIGRAPPPIEAYISVRVFVCNALCSYDDDVGC